MPKIKFSYIDYKNLPESETKRYELLDGDIFMIPSPNYYHQCILRNLETILWDFIKKNKLGTVLFAPFDVHLGDDVVQPDILYVKKENSDIMRRDEICGAPDLLIEILSPATAERDTTYKKTLYARHGVKEYWIVYPEEKKIEVFTLMEGGYKLADTYNKDESLISNGLSGLKINLKEIF